MNIIKRIIRKVFHKKYAYGDYKTYEEYHRAYTENIANRIRSGGGYVGNNVDFYDLKIDDNNLFFIGDNVTLTNCRLLTHDACLTKTTGCVRFAPIYIGNNVFVGADSIILPGTKIGNDCIIGAGTVVAHDIPDNSVAVGNPCRVICFFDDFVQREKAAINNGSVVERGSATLDSFAEIAKYKHFVVDNDIYKKFLSRID